MYLEKSLKEYSDLIASESLSPGSESSLAVTGTLASSLLIFYFKNIYRFKEDTEKLELRKIIKTMEQVKAEIMDAVDEAVVIYKNDNNPKEVVVKEGVVIPLLIAQKCNNLLECIVFVHETIGLVLNKDKYTAGLSAGTCKAKAGLMGSLFCVESNLKELERGELSSFARDEKNRLMKRGENNYQQIIAAINNSWLVE